MGILDSFADRVQQSQPPSMWGQLGPGVGPPTGSTMPPPAPPPPESPVAQPVSAQPGVSIQIGGGQDAPQRPPFDYGQESGSPTSFDMSPYGLESPAVAWNKGMARSANQEGRRQEFKQSLSPEVSSAFAAFMDGIAQEEARKSLVAGSTAGRTNMGV